MSDANANPGTSPSSGMRDFLPLEAAHRRRVLNAIVSSYRRDGFSEIGTPCMERLEVLQNAQGGENDKLTYKVLKRGDKLSAALQAHPMRELADAGLRFDLTVPLSRFVGHHSAELPLPFKAIQVGPVWRAERPQKGRFREFIQCDIDILGEASSHAEIELILATAKCLSELGVDGTQIRINDRRIITQFARYCGFADSFFETFFIALDKLDKIGLDGVVREFQASGAQPQAIHKFQSFLGAKAGASSTLRELQAEFGPATDAACDDVDEIIRGVEKASAGRVAITFDLTLVRGMGYYTGPIFEAVHPQYASSLGGGGRYDGMIGRFSGRSIPACGFSIGFERLLDLIAQRGQMDPGPERCALLYDAGDDFIQALRAAEHLRSNGREILLVRRKKNFREQVSMLNKIGVHRALKLADTTHPDLAFFDIGPDARV